MRNRPNDIHQKRQFRNENGFLSFLSRGSTFSNISRQYTYKPPYDIIYCFCFFPFLFVLRSVQLCIWRINVLYGFSIQHSSYLKILHSVFGVFFLLVFRLFQLYRHWITILFRSYIVTQSGRRYTIDTLCIYPFEL